ncbi:MAG: hypothetical protein ABI333_22595 [bacterium]
MKPLPICLLLCLTLPGCGRPARKPAPAPAPARQTDPPAMRAATRGPGNTAENSAPITLTHSVQVPKDVPQKMRFHPKRDQAYDDDAHAMYRRSHRGGWQECLQTYLRGQLTPTSTASIKQQFGLQQRADQEGFKQCRTEIFALIKRHGAAPVKAALTRQHGAAPK